MSNTIYILSLLDKCSQGDDCAFVLTFQATGCPNKNPTPSQIAWWKKQTDDEVFSDMFEYCTRVRDGKANQRQRLQCCGKGKGCTKISCKKQTALKLQETTGNNSFVSLIYILMYIK